jgi:hypothetical protein
MAKSLEDRKIDNIQQVAGREDGKPKFTARRKTNYLKILEETGDRSLACKLMGLDPQALRAALGRDRIFYSKVLQMEAKYQAELEKEARRRAIDGVEEGVYFKGKQIATEKKYSDALLSKLLDASDRDKYSKHSKVDTTTNVNITDTTVRTKLASALGLTLAETPTIEDEIEGEFTEE